MITSGQQLFRVGIATQPSEHDPRYFDEQLAIDRAAVLVAMPEYHRVPIAVWNEVGDIVHLWLCGQQFRSES